MFWKSVCLMLLTGGIIGGMAWYQSRESDAAPLEYLYPQLVDAQDSLKIQGTVTEKSRTQVVTLCAAEVQRVLVKPGETVEKGQLLASVKPIGQAGNGPDDLLHRTAVNLDLDSLSGAKCIVDYQGDTDAAMVFLFAPTSGLVLECGLQEGNRVPSYGSCFLIADTAEMRITARVGEETVPYLRTGLRCTVEVEALGLSGLTGTLEQMAPYASRQPALLAQTSDVTTEIQVLLDPAEGLQPGYTAEADFIVEEYKEVLTVPYACVGQDSDGEYVMTIQDGYVYRTAVATGKEFAHGVQILSGIGEQTPVLALVNEEMDGKAIRFT